MSGPCHLRMDASLAFLAALTLARTTGSHRTNLNSSVIVTFLSGIVCAPYNHTNPWFVAGMGAPKRGDRGDGVGGEGLSAGGR